MARRCPGAQDDAERDGGEGAAEAAEGGGAAAAAPAADVAVEAAEPATDQWVQCDRCRTWRIVPDAAWPSVEADPRDVRAPAPALSSPLPPHTSFAGPCRVCSCAQVPVRAVRQASYSTESHWEPQ